MSVQVHIVRDPEPVIWHQEDREALCKAIVEKAVQVNIVPDVIKCSVGGVASTFGRDMCTDCQLADEPSDGWISFAVSKEDAKKLEKRQHEYAEVS